MPLEENLIYIPFEDIHHLRTQLTGIFFGHIFLTVLLLVGIILQLFSSPPSLEDRFELLVLWVGAGMTILDITFDLPVMMKENMSMDGAFVNNTCHINSYVHLYEVPLIFGAAGLLILVRAITHLNWKDFLQLFIFAGSLIGFMMIVEVREKEMLAAGKPSRDAIQVIGIGHIALTISIFLSTILSLSAQKDVINAAKTMKNQKVD